MLHINPVSVISFANIFSHSVDCVLVLAVVSFADQKLLILMWFLLFIFAFISFSLGDRAKKYCKKGYFVFNVGKGKVCLYRYYCCQRS